MPTAPPRLFPQEGFVDTITDFAQVNHDSGLVKLFINPYAAIPSMHVAFSTMIGVTGVLISRHTITKVLWAAYPVLVFWVVVVTANHFWIDGAFGLLVAVLSAARRAQILARVRPGRLVLAARDGLSARDALRRYGEPGLVAAALGVAYLIIQPDSADHAAQVFRSDLFADQGIVDLGQLLVRRPPPARLRGPPARPRAR